MPYDFQIAIDAAEPHPLAGWWAQTLGWEVEPQDADFIRRMIAAGYATEAETMIYDGSLVWSDGAAIGHPEGGRPRVLFQRVPEAKSVKNRLHLDVRVGEENVDAQVALLTERGARFLHEGWQGPHRWVTMADPEDNEFCVT